MKYYSLFTVFLFTLIFSFTHAATSGSLSLEEFSALVATEEGKAQVYQHYVETRQTHICRLECAVPADPSTELMWQAFENIITHGADIFEAFGSAHKQCAEFSESVGEKEWNGVLRAGDVVAFEASPWDCNELVSVGEAEDQ